MSYPCIEIDLRKIEENVRIINRICNNSGVKVVGVTKASNGSIEIAETMVRGGVKTIGDSRLKNLKRYTHIPVKKMLIRLPMLSEVNELVRIADISLNSEIKTIRAISREAKKINKTHEVILMIELGDLREGIYDEDEIMQIVKEVLNLKGVKLKGIGANLSCFGAIKPTKDNLGRLVKIKKDIKDRFGINLEIISGGNSGTLHLIQKGDLPKEVNQIRIGTAFLLGLIEVDFTRIPNTYSDAFKLSAEIIEIKEKPSKPFGEVGVDAFRNKPVFKDIGIIKRAICAIGKQDCDPLFMYPEDKNIFILGSSSDHIILDITNSDIKYDIGDKITFILDYVSILRSMTSNHVKKIYIK